MLRRYLAYNLSAALVPSATFGVFDGSHMPFEVFLCLLRRLTVRTDPTAWVTAGRARLSVVGAAEFDL